VNPDRYHLTLSSAGRTVQQGWWPLESTARSKFREWVGSGVADARVTLVDEETGAVLTEWPEPS
jgi:hypothetical protein